MQLVPPTPICLGWRMQDFSPYDWDYKAYEERAREVLLQPKARAAVQMGGIVWRLAVHLLGEEAVRSLDGPSADVWRHGQEFCPERGDCLYADSLSIDELDVVCGVYKVYTST